MFSLELECPAERRDWLIADLWEQGVAGIVELDERHLRAFFEDGADREALGRRYPGARWRLEERRDWVEYARAIWQPMAVGERFYLVPEWRDDPAPPGRLRISVNPGMAFGTGVHPTTQLCLEALERRVRPGMTVLDVGTGSAILAWAARLLGAERVFGCDLDPVAVQIARSRLPAIFIGSADAVAGASADLVVANLSPEAIGALANELFRVVRPGGLALLSGFERREIPLLQRAATAYEKGDWALLEVA